MTFFDFLVEKIDVLCSGMLFLLIGSTVLGCKPKNLCSGLLFAFSCCLYKTRLVGCIAHINQRSAYTMCAPIT